MPMRRRMHDELDRVRAQRRRTLPKIHCQSCCACTGIVAPPPQPTQQLTACDVTWTVSPACTHSASRHNGRCSSATTFAMLYRMDNGCTHLTTSAASDGQGYRLTATNGTKIS